MTWTAYRVTFRLLSPMHVGWRKLGNLQQTRPYITGRNLWGAMTARLAREQGDSDYNKISRQVDEQLAFTYFYPSTKSDTVSLWPWREQWDKFAWTFLGSYASTALESNHSAEEGSLHETEFIAPYARNQDINQKLTPVYFVGYIFVRDDCKLLWQSVLDRLQLGGERNYGWGRVCLKEEPTKEEKCFGYDLDCTGDRPQITVPDGRELLAHTNSQCDTVGKVSNEARNELVSRCMPSLRNDFPNGINSQCVKSDGIMEPLVGRETKSNTGFGKSLTEAQICWAPGSMLLEEKTFQIQARGIWK